MDATEMAVTVDLAGRNWFKSGWLLRVPCLVHADAWVRDVLRGGAIPEKRGDLAAPVGAHRCGGRIMRVMVYWSKSRWLRAVGTGPELADRRKWHRKLHSKGWQTQSRVPRAVELDRLSCAPLRVDSVLRHHPRSWTGARPMTYVVAWTRCRLPGPARKPRPSRSMITASYWRP